MVDNNTTAQSNPYFNNSLLHIDKGEKTKLRVLNSFTGEKVFCIGY